MNVQLDWQVADDDDNWESIAQAGARTRLRFPGWMWGIAAAVVVLLVVGPAIAVRYRYRRALRQVTFQIQDVIDLEARALAQGDVERYLAQQDASMPGWVVQQAARIGRECPEADVAAPGPGPILASTAPDLCPLATPAQVARVEMRGDVAWVEVAQPQAALRQVRFYRQTRQGWVHTAPRTVFWQDPVELAFGRVLVRAHRRDLPAIEPQVAHIVDVVDDVCAILDCPTDVRLEVRFSHHDVPPGLSGTVLTVASPWLMGVPVDGAVDEGYSRTLTYWAVYGLASQMVRHDEGLWSCPAFPPYAARAEMLHACAIVYCCSGRLGAMRDTCRPTGLTAR